MIADIRPLCPVCGHKIQSKEHKSQAKKCSKIKLQRRLAGEMPDVSLVRKTPTKTCVSGSGYGIKSRRYSE